MSLVKPITITLCALMILAGCAANNIGLKSNFKEAEFEIGKTKKDDVINYLGLPQNIIKDNDGRDHFFYEGASRLVGMCIGCGNTNQGVGLIPSLMNQSEIKNGAEYVFDHAGILLTKFETQ